MTKLKKLNTFLQGLAGALMFLFILGVATLCFVLIFRGSLPGDTPVPLEYDANAHTLSFFGDRLPISPAFLEKALSYPAASAKLSLSLLPESAKNTAVRLWEVTRGGIAVLISKIWSFLTGGY